MDLIAAIGMPMSLRYSILTVVFLRSAWKKGMSDLVVSGLPPKCRILRFGIELVANNEEKHINPMIILLYIP